jgi:hypothetical protein
LRFATNKQSVPFYESLGIPASVLLLFSDMVMNLPLGQEHSQNKVQEQNEDYIPSIL